jgi:nucleoside-diphosphate-sugar epimerase
VLAAGVPRQHLPVSEHHREVALVRDAVTRCRADGQTLVFFSTTSMYGSADCHGREDERVTASSAYGQHKLDLEALIRDSGVDHLILRLTQVVGPGEPRFRLIPMLVSQLRAGQIRVERYARRDLLYIADFVTILDQLLSAGATNEVVNVASGDCVPVSDIVDHLEQRLNLTTRRQDIADGLSYCSSVAKLRTLVPATAGLGFGPGYFHRMIDRYLEEEQARPNESYRVGLRAGSARQPSAGEHPAAQDACGPLSRSCPCR